MLTHQDVINIFYGAADVLHIAGGWTLVEKAGWQWLAADRNEPFDPSHLDDKPPGLSEAEWAHLHMRIDAALGEHGHVHAPAGETVHEPELEAPTIAEIEPKPEPVFEAPVIAEAEPEPEPYSKVEHEAEDDYESAKEFGHEEDDNPDFITSLTDTEPEDYDIEPDPQLGHEEDGDEPDFNIRDLTDTRSEEYAFAALSEEDEDNGGDDSGEPQVAIVEEPDEESTAAGVNEASMAVVHAVEEKGDDSGETGGYQLRVQPLGPQKSLYGPQFAVPYNSYDAEKCYAADVVCSKVIGEWPEMLRLARELPDSIHIYREWDMWETIFPHPSTDPMPVLVERWMQHVRVEERLEEFLKAGGKTLVFEAFNEPGIGDPELVKFYTEFEVLRIEAMAKIGALACIGQFSVGSPNNENMQAFLPAIKALNDTTVDGQTGYLGIHEYGTIWPWAWMGKNQGADINADPFPDVTDPEATNPAWLLGRFQTYYSEVFAPAGYGDTPMLITETGLDTIADPRIKEYMGREEGDDYPHGYRTLFSFWGNRLAEIQERSDYQPPEALMSGSGRLKDFEGFYVELLKWQDDFMRQFPFIKGATPFLSGGYDDWESFWIQHTAMDRFMDYVSAENEKASA